MDRQIALDWSAKTRRQLGSPPQQSSPAYLLDLSLNRVSGMGIFAVRCSETIQPGNLPRMVSTDVFNAMSTSMVCSPAFTTLPWWAAMIAAASDVETAESWERRRITRVMIALYHRAAHEVA